jgi:rhamnulose-1-phosphate aldolase/alcohol dehydrogenase
LDLHTLKHVNYLWDDETAGKLSPQERLIYRSNLLGSDLRIVNTGGGNTSAKLIERDPLTGRDVEVLWVKGSGGDLRTSTLESFASLYLEQLLSLKDTYAASEPRGPKTEAEDRMPGLYPNCAFNLNPRAASIDTPLHAFVPFKHVDHTHPNAVIAVAASRRSKELTSEIYGEEVGWTPWLRPGFELGLEIERMCAANPKLKGVILAQHGLIDWADDDKDCYELTLRLIEQAAEYIESRDKGEQTFGGARYEALTPAERDEALLELPLPPMPTVQSDAAIMRFVNSRDAPRLAAMGTSCPDHFLRTKIKPLFVLKEQLGAGLDQYRKDYAAYYQTCKHADSPPMRDPNPAVILIPGIGMITWSRLTAEFYSCAVEVMRGAEAIDQYVALPQQEAFDIEYWLLEEAKLKRRANQPE